MVVRLKDIRNQTAPVKKTGVVSLSQLRDKNAADNVVKVAQQDAKQKSDREAFQERINRPNTIVKEGLAKLQKPKEFAPLRVDKVQRLAQDLKRREEESAKRTRESTVASMAAQEKAYQGSVAQKIDNDPIARNVAYVDKLAMRTANRFGDFLGLGKAIKEKNPEVYNKLPESFRKVMDPVYTEPANKAERGADLTGEVLSYVAPTEAAYKLIGKAGFKKLPTVSRFLRGLTANAGVQGVKEGTEEALDQNDKTLKQRLTNVSLAGAIGGVADSALPLIQSFIKKPLAGAERATDEIAASTDLTPRQSSNAEISPTQPVRLNDLRNAEPTTSAPRERGLIGNIESSGKLNEDAMGAIRQGDTTYEPINNADTVRQANARLEANGMGSNKGYLMNKDPGKDYFSPEDIALGFRLIDEYTAIKDYDSVAEIVQQLSKAGTKGGQAVQINAIYDRLTPEGVLKVATRVLNQGVESVSAQKALSPEITEQLYTAATKLRNTTGGQGLAKDAITLIEKARTGSTLTADEVTKIRAFADDVNNLIGRSEPKPTGNRVIDRVKKASAYQADAARARLRNARNIGFAATNQGNPVIDYAIIGFDHMMNGAVKFADFSGKMQTEFGDSVNSYLDKAYLKAFGKYRRVNKIPQSEFEKITNRAISGEGFSEADADALRRMAIELSDLQGAARNEALNDLQSAFNTLREGTRGQKAASVLRSFQLGNVRTILRNEISNNAFYALEQTKRKFLDTPIDVVASKLTGKNREIFFKGSPNAWNQYFKDWSYAYKQGRRGLNPGGLQSQYDLGNLAFNPSSTKITDRLGSFLERNVGAFLKAGDYAAANRAISNELSQISRAKAYAEGFRGKELSRKAEEYFHTADDTMSAQAEEYGKYMAFQDKNFLSDAAVNLRDKVLNVGKDFGLGNIVLNYPKTPANIFMRAIDYSPLGFVKFMGQMGKGIIGKDVTKKQLINTFTRALAGTGIAGMGMYLSQIGILNVLPSKNVGMSDLERKAGKIPNSLNIDALKRYVLSFGDREAAKPRQGDTYASVDWFQPLAIPASVGAAYGQADQPGRLKTTINAADVATQSIDAALESFGNMSAYKNIKDLVGSSYSTPSEKLGKLSANAASAFVPSLIGQTRNVVDPYQRDPKEPGFFGQAKGQLMNRIPGLSNKLPVKLDTFGDEKKNEFSVGKRILNAFVNPSIVDTYEPSPEAKTVLELIQRTGETRLAPDRPLKSFTFKKESYGFKPDDYRSYQKATGENITAGLKKNLEFLNNPNISDERKIKRVDEVIRDAGDKAKKEYRKLKGIR